MLFFSEKFIEKVKSYAEKNPDGTLPTCVSHSWDHAAHAYSVTSPASKAKFSTLMDVNYMRSLAAPGESVGILVAQVCSLLCCAIDR